MIVFLFYLDPCQEALFAVNTVAGHWVDGVVRVILTDGALCTLLWERSGGDDDAKLSAVYDKASMLSPSSYKFKQGLYDV